MNYKNDLVERLKAMKNMEGFPIGKDEDIISLSEPPYYTACPNPYISDYISKNCKQYDETNDNYHREPFVGDVSEGKSHPIYNAHTYHTKVPHLAIVPFIEHFTEPGDIILDGFCGTGMTGVAAQLTKRKAILSDLSPIASYIAYNYNNPIDVIAFMEKAENILKEVEEECGWMYQTMHTDNINTGIINYTVWSDVFISPFSGSEFVFYDVAVQKDTGKVNDEFPCPHTGAMLTKKMCSRALVKFYDTALNREIVQVKQVPVLINYSVRTIINGKYKLTSFEKKPDDMDLEIIDKIAKANIPYWYPTDRMMFSDNERWGDAFRAGYHLGISNVHHFFHKRNLWALSALNTKCDTPLLRIWFTSQLINLSRLNRYRPGVSFPYNPLSGTLYIGSQISEANIFQAYKNKIGKLVKAIHSVKSNNIVYTGSATQQSIPDKSIDYIFTDPPFGDNLMYSELNFIWEAWLKVFTNNKKEGIINNSQRKDLSSYNLLMLESFKEYYRVLKPKRWITVVFHNSRSSVWNGIQEAITKAGFIISQVSTLDKQQGSYKQVTAPGAVANDLVISAFKPKESFENAFLKAAGIGLEVTFLQEFLENLPVKTVIERTEKMLYSKMIAYYIQRGYEINYDAKAFYSLLVKHFICEDGFWFTSNQVNSFLEYKKRMKLEGLDEIKSGGMFLFITDEKSSLVWLYSFITEPKSFSEISIAFNQLANIQGDNIPELKDMLDQNFIYENEKYRRPKTEPEHNQITEKREKVLLREFEGLLIKSKSEKGKIKLVRKEALSYGFEMCYKTKRFSDIITIANKLDKSILENSSDLNDFVEAAEIMVEGIS